jgi:hypothetical protein
MKNQAVEKAVGAYFNGRDDRDSATSLDVWESTPYDEYDGDPWQFTECLTEGVDGFRIEENGTDNPVIHRA